MHKQCSLDLYYFVATSTEGNLTIVDYSHFTPKHETVGDYRI